MSNTSATCPRCEEGQIPCNYAYYPGRYYGPPEDCYPDESEVTEVGACENCGASDWTDVESEKIEREAAESWEPPDGPDWETEL